MRVPVLCFVLKLMRIPMKPLLALLLAVLLPMRGFASATLCEPPGQGHGADASHGVENTLRFDTPRNALSQSAAERPHCTDSQAPQHADSRSPHHADNRSPHHADNQGPHHAHNQGPSHAHACGDCCGGVAAVLTAPRFTVPRAAAALIVGRLARPHPALAIDRLDRPPRQPAC
jgi:hypothetical protein